MTKKDLEDLSAFIEEDYEDVDGPHIDLKKYGNALWKKRKYFFISIPVAFILAVLLTMGRPKYYVVNVKLAPELSSMSNSTGGLTSILRNFGLRSMSGSNSDGDAILPNLYPDLMNSQLFRVSLFDVPVKSRNGKINTTYYDYLENYQKSFWMSRAISSVMGLFSFGKDDEASDSTYQTVNAAALNARQTRIAKAIARNVICDVDERTLVITISVKAQDPVICATVADSTCRRLQEFITGYRTKKAQVEYDHVLEQYDIAQQEYNEAKDKVAAFNNGNWNIVSESMAIEKMSLENQMQLKYSAFSTMSQQLLAARVKLDEARPVFTVLDGANVPLKPAGPKRRGFILGFVFLVFIVQSAWLIWKDKQVTTASSES